MACPVRTSSSCPSTRAILNVGNPGFQYALDTRLLANGEHFIDVIVTDAHGSTTYIGKKRIVVNNVGG